MERSITTSVRLPAELRKRLDAYARRHRVGRNRVITEALRDFLGHIERRALEEEARRQSVLAGGAPGLATDWEHAAETDPWPSR